MGRWPGDRADGGRVSTAPLPPAPPALEDPAPRRIAGLRVVMSWPDSEFAPARPPRGRARARLAGFAGTLLIAGGVLSAGLALLSQQHAPAPGRAAPFLPVYHARDTQSYPIN